MERQDRQAKTFDSTVCFMFFGDWTDSISMLETEADRNSPAYMLFKAIADYSMYGEEPDFSQPVNKAFQLLWPILSKQIDDSVENRKRRFENAGMTATQKKVLDAYKKKPLASIREIKELADVSKNTVERVRRKYADVIQGWIDACGNASPYTDNNSFAGDNANTYVYAGDNVNANAYANVSIGTGQNQDRIGTGQDSGDGTIHSVSGDNVQQEDMFADLKDDDGELPF